MPSHVKLNKKWQYNASIVGKKTEKNYARTIICFKKQCSMYKI